MFDKLDLAFAMDCTGSMSSQINEAKQVNYFLNYTFTLLRIIPIQ